MRTTREAALRAPGLQWTDSVAEHETSEQTLLPGRETRKMNLYQAVRDAMRCAILLFED